MWILYGLGLAVVSRSRLAARERALTEAPPDADAAGPGAKGGADAAPERAA